MRKDMDSVCGKVAPGGDRSPTILKNTWANKSGLDQTKESYMSASNDMDVNVDCLKSGPTQKPTKKVSFRLSELRKQSLTGSLPDLTKASSKEMNNCMDLLEIDQTINRDPLPEGSDVFRAAMEEIDSEADDGSNESIDKLTQSWNVAEDKKLNAMHRKFHSKTTAMIHAKLFNSPHPPKYLEKLHLPKSNPNSPGQQRKLIIDKENSNSDRCRSPISHMVQKTNHKLLQKDGMPQLSPQSSTKCRVTTKVLTRSISGPPSLHITSNTLPSSSSPPRLSPLVSGELSEVQFSTEKMGVRRTLSTPTNSPRILLRPKQGHSKLFKSASLESD